MNVQATMANKVNEITGVTNSVGTAWATQESAVIESSQENKTLGVY